MSARSGKEFLEVRRYPGGQVGRTFSVLSPGHPCLQRAGRYVDRATARRGGAMTLPPLPEKDHHCESCGLRYGDLTPSAALGLIRSHPAQYRRRLQHLPVDVLRRRPASAVWSALEYTCHVRNVYDVYETRVRRTLTEHEPTLEPMRNDERAAQRAYHQQPLAAVLLDLERNADRFAALVSEISEPQWSRCAVRLPRERRSVLWMVRQAAHEGLHHLHDIGAPGIHHAATFNWVTW